MKNDDLLLSEAQIEGFEQHYHYDASFLKAMRRETPDAFAAYCHFAVMGRFTGDLPPEIIFVAKIAAMMTEDCGPCTQLNVRMAREAGVSPDILRAVLGRGGDLPDDLEQVRRYATGVATNQLEDGLLETLRERHGNAGLAELGVAIASARVYPCLKRAMGYAGPSCELVDWEV